MFENFEKKDKLFKKTFEEKRKVSSKNNFKQILENDSFQSVKIALEISNFTNKLITKKSLILINLVFHVLRTIIKLIGSLIMVRFFGVTQIPKK